MNSPSGAQLGRSYMVLGRPDKARDAYQHALRLKPDDAALIITIITMAHNLGLRVVAEGVETDEQLKFLRLMKCEEWQGYLYSKAVRPEEFEALLVAERNGRG